MEINLKSHITPFGHISKKAANLYVLGWIVTIMLFWILGSQGEKNLFPTPSQVGKGFSQLWNEGLVVHVASSIGLCLKSILIATFFSLSLVYISPIPLLRPMSAIISRFRFLPLTGITFYFAMATSSARAMQTWILVLFMSTFFITSLLAMIKNIPPEEFDHAKAMRYSKAGILLEVIIKGRFDYVIESLRQNLAIVWMMLVTVESILVASGGLGVLIKNSEKWMNHGRIVALQILILLIGLLIDVSLRAIRRGLFHYSKF
jgi:NitT/TauT family transport system permease protein